LLSYFSSRGIVFGGPLVHDCSSAMLENFLIYFSTFLQGKVIYLETRNYFDVTAYKTAFEQCVWQYTDYTNVQLNLTGKTTAALISSFTYNRRNEIKKTISQGTTFGICTAENEVSEIYTILKDLYKNKVKLPIPSFEYFIAMYRAGIMKAFFVKHNSILIGGSFCMILAGKGLYTYYYCGLTSYKKNIYPTHLAVLAALEYAVANGIPHVDFMGAGKSNEAYGVRKYKLQFGGELVEHGRYTKVLNAFLYFIGKKGLGLWKLLKPKKWKGILPLKFTPTY
jgi:serine/alanine adding enzyme